MTGFTRSMSADPWHVDRLDLAGYLERLGVAVREPGRAALDEPHEAHVRTFTFDNIDVLLQQHPRTPRGPGQVRRSVHATKLLLLKDPDGGSLYMCARHLVVSAGYEQVSL